MLEDTEDFSEATIVLLPPGDGHNSDEDSGDEDRVEFCNLPRRQLISRADLEINFGSHVEASTVENHNEEVVPRRSSRINTSDSPFDVSGDLWGDDESLDTETFSVQEEIHVNEKWLSEQVPPLPPATWQKRDLNSKEFVDPPMLKDKTLDKITPFGIFNLFFDDAVLQYIVDMTNLYATRDKGLVGFSTNSSEIRTFIAILLLSGYNDRPRLRMFWEKSPDVYCEAVSNAMSRTRFEDIMKCFHICDNLNLARGDKMAKVRPFFDMINQRCLDNRANLPNLSIDEAMLPYYCRNSSKQRIQNKPIRVGYKMWVMAEDSGYVVQFDPYQGAKSSGPQRSSATTWGLGEKVVLELLDVLPKGPSYHVFIDNFFCSVRLLKFLGSNNIKASGTLRQNRLSISCSLRSKAILKKEKRGAIRQETADDDSTTVIAWKDNKVVLFASNCDGAAPKHKVERYCRDAKKKILVEQPKAIQNYNGSMGGVDRADQNVAAYRIGVRSKKWWWPLFAWIPDMVMQNAWVLYRQQKLPSEKNHDLLSFRREVVSVYLAKYSLKNSTRSQVASVPRDIRFDMEGHFSDRCPTTKTCGLCKKNTRRWCVKCKKGLHDHCFNAYHGV